MGSRSRAVLLGILCILVAPRVATPCSSFVLSATGSLIFAANYDNEFRSGLLFINGRGVEKQGWEPGTTGRLARWSSKYGSVTFNLGGAQFAWGGMNEAGLAMSTMILSGTRFPDADERPPLASQLWVQYVLDTCDSVEDLIAMEKLVRISDTHEHFLVCDRTGASAAIEFLEGKMVCHVDETMAIPALTNERYATCLEGYMNGTTMAPDSYHSVARFIRLADRLGSFEEDGSESPVDFAFEALENVANRTLTRWSVVFDLDARTLGFTTDENSKRRTIALDGIDFDAGPELRMLDVHAEREGNLLEHFVPYDHDVNRDLARRAMDHFRPDGFSDESLDRILELFESFSRPRSK
jgi:penicillin V acylase-like amidase (Ntn superfamily)